MFQDDLLAELEELEQEELDKNLLDIKGTENVPLPSVPSTSLPARPGIKCCYVRLVLIDLICFPVWLAAYSPFVLPFGAVKQLHNCCSSGYISVYPTKQTAIYLFADTADWVPARCSGPAVVCPLQESFLTAGVSCCCMFQLVGTALVMLYNNIHTVFCMSSTAAKTAEWKRQDSQTVSAYV